MGGRDLGVSDHSFVADLEDSGYVPFSAGGAALE